MSRIIKSKIYKPFIVLLVAVILVFSFEVNRSKAIAPLLAWGAWAIAGIVAEEVVEMGIRHVTADGKATSKSKSKKIADEIFDNYDSYGFDFLDAKPVKQADGSLVFIPSANDRAKIAKKIADEFGDVIDDYDDYSANEMRIYKDDTEYAGINFVSATFQSAIDSKNFVKKMYSVRINKVSTRKITLTFTSLITGSQVTTRDLDSGTSDSPKIINIDVKANSLPFTTSPYVPTNNAQCVIMEASGISLGSVNCDVPTQTAFIKLLPYPSVVSYGGLMVPRSLKNVYNALPNMSDDMVLPNNAELSNKPVILKNIYSPTTNDTDYDWETINNDYETDNSISNKFEQNVDTYLENGDLNQNTYNDSVINNYYTDSTYPVKSGDVTVIVDVDVPPPVVIDDDDDTSTGDLPPQAEVLDRTLISYAKQTYDYLGDSIDGAITSMRDITDDASGLVDYLDTSFRWLPAEWRALFGSAFILGVFAHFMRR